LITALINGNELRFEKDKYKSFREFYEENKLSNMVLSELIINDNKVPVSMIEEIYNATFEGDEKIKMNFDELIPFTLNLLPDLKGYIDQFENALPVFAKEIKTGSLESVQGLKNLQEGLKALETMKINLLALTGMKEEDYPELHEKRHELHEILEEMNNAILKKNWDELSQLLEFDLPAAIEYYKELFSKSKEVLEQRKA
jgi:hypothetical protein